MMRITLILADLACQVKIVMHFFLDINDWAIFQDNAVKIKRNSGSFNATSENIVRN